MAKCGFIVKGSGRCSLQESMRRMGSKAVENILTLCWKWRPINGDFFDKINKGLRLFLAEKRKKKQEIC